MRRVKREKEGGAACMWVDGKREMGTADSSRLAVVFNLKKMGERRWARRLRIAVVGPLSTLWERKERGDRLGRLSEIMEAWTARVYKVGCSYRVEGRKE
ncbi:hypothetical protein HAX54_007525, partial [Datura stramonium]|nr:hypothetical protein [Datura stramonium]